MFALYIKIRYYVQGTCEKKEKYIIQQSTRTSVYLLSMGAKEEKSEKAFDDSVALVWRSQQ